MTNLDIIKSILNLPDNSLEPMISYTYNIVETKVRIYCGYDSIEEIPKGLNDIIIDIALNQCKIVINNSTDSTTSIGSTPAQVGILKKKTIGGTSYEYDISSEAISAAANSSDTTKIDFLTDYVALLKEFRKKRIILI